MALGSVGSLDDIDGLPADAAQGVLELASGIALVCEDVAQPREASDDFSKHQRRTIAVLDIGGMVDGMDEIAFGVGQDMPLASLGLPARIIAARTAAFRSYQALAVDHASTRCLVPACDGVDLSPSQRRDLWDRFYMAAPRPRTPFEASYSDRKLRSRASRGGRDQREDRPEVAPSIIG